MRHAERENDRRLFSKHRLVIAISAPGMKTPLLYGLTDPAVRRPAPPLLPTRSLGDGVIFQLPSKQERPMKSFRREWAGALLVMSSVCTTASAAPTATIQSKAEVAHLLDHVATPGCKFERNGTWYDGAQARQHLQEKYDYLLKRDMASDAEAFIANAASSSSMSGKPYLVKCGNAAPVQSGPWLTQEVQRYRARAAKPAK
jgi:hypothetical protein